MNISFILILFLFKIQVYSINLFIAFICNVDHVRIKIIFPLLYSFLLVFYYIVWWFNSLFQILVIFQSVSPNMCLGTACQSKILIMNNFYQDFRPNLCGLLTAWISFVVVPDVFEIRIRFDKKIFPQKED